MNAAIPDLAGMLMQEKYDGVFCRWTGRVFLTRNGHRLNPPAWWITGMPTAALDGELWTHRGGFDELVSAIQRRRDPWAGVSYQVFDMPVLRVPFRVRLAMLAKVPLPAHCALVPSRVCAGRDDLDQTEDCIVRSGGEGVILRGADWHWRPGGYIKVKRMFPDLDRSLLD